MIGLADKASVRDLVVREQRFGVPDPKPLFKEKRTQLSFRVDPVADATVTLSHPSGGEEMALDGEVFVPALPGLPKDLFNVRVQAEFIQLVISGREVKLNANFDPNQPVSLEIANRIASVWALLSEGARDRVSTFDACISVRRQFPAAAVSVRAPVGVIT